MDGPRQSRNGTSGNELIRSWVINGGHGQIAPSRRIPSGQPLLGTHPTSLRPPHYVA